MIEVVLWMCMVEPTICKRDGGASVELSNRRTVDSSGSGALDRQLQLRVVDAKRFNLKNWFGCRTDCCSYRFKDNRCELTAIQKHGFG